MRLRFLIFFTLISTNYIFGQKLEFGEIDLSELKSSKNVLDSTAHSAFLFKNAELNMIYNYGVGWKYELKVTNRIKIYKKEGFKYATVQIPYYKGNSNAEDVNRIRAHIFNLVDGQIEKTKLKNRDIIDNDVDDNWSEIKFTFPNLKEGSVIEYTYVYSSPFISFLPEWSFQDRIPVQNSEYTLTIPKIFGYNEHFKGFHNVNKTLESLASYSSGSLNVNALKYKYHSFNIPAIEDEGLVNNLDNYVTSVQHELAAYKSPNSGEIFDYKTSWDKIAKELMNSDLFGKQLFLTKYFEEDLNEIINKKLPDRDEIEMIFNYVKAKIKWNEYIGLYCSDDLKHIYEKGSGNTADINIMLAGMLKYAGHKAYPVILRTVSSGMPSKIPSTRFYNYVITAVEKNDGSFILLDATEKYAHVNILPFRCLNFYGRLFRENLTSEKIELFANEKSDKDFLLNINLDSIGNYTGQMRIKYSNYYALRQREKLSDTDEKTITTGYENMYNIDIVKYSYSNLEDITKPLVETISFNSQNQVDLINSSIYFNPLFFLARKQHPFKLEKKDRKLPINYTYPKSQKFIITINYPKNYKLEYLTTNEAINLTDGIGNYKFITNTSNQKSIQIMVNYNINATFLDAKYYDELKKFYNAIVNKETDKIVLKKIE